MIQKNTILMFYQEKLEKLNNSYTTIKTKTSFGKTNVLIFGDETKPALFLVHGLNSAAPFAVDSVSFLVEKYQVFAIDVLGQPNKSDFVRLNKKNNDYGKWLLEIINHFKVDAYSLCGISFGAFPILKSLLIDNKKVTEVFLISPAGIVNGNLLKTISRFLVPMRKFRKTKKEHYLKKCLSNLYDNFDDFTYQFQKEVFLNFKMDFSITPNFKTIDLKKMKTPISIIASEKDFFAPALKLKKRSKNNISSLKNFIVLKNEKHIPFKRILEDAFKKMELS